MGGVGPFCKKAPFRLHFQVIFRSHFSKSNQKVNQKVAEKEPKMATVNDPIDDSHRFVSRLKLPGQMTPFVLFRSTCCVSGCPSTNFARLIRRACVLVLHVDDVKCRSPLCLKTL